MSNTIAVYNFKGGVGKTSTTLSLAYSWSRSFKVLVVDCDPQCNLTQTIVEENLAHDHTSLFKLTRRFLHNEIPKVKPIEINPYLHVIPGDFNMSEMETNTQFISFGHIICYKLLSAVKTSYDFVLLDFPTHFGVTVKSFIANVDSILIPSVPDSFSLAGFKKLLSYLAEVERKKPLQILGIFFNQYRKNTLLHQRIVKEVESELGNLILNQRIRESVRVGEANHENKSIYSFIEQSAVAEDFLKLSEEVIGKLNTQDLDKVVQDFGLQRQSIK